MSVVKLESVIDSFETIGDFFRYALSAFSKYGVSLGHGTDCLEDEAWWLIAGGLHLPLDASRSLFFNARLSSEEKIKLHGLIEARSIQKVPTAYLLHEAYQHGYAFYVDERVLIPRSPIAEFILKKGEPWLEPDIGPILDLCTGSGCLAVLAGLSFSDARVDAVDISPLALQVAEMNVEKYQLQSQVRLIQSDLFQALAAQKYDLIISNPPYVDREDLSMMPAEYSHEPMLALEAGEDGLQIVRRILLEAAQYLNPEGILIVEVGNSRFALEEAYPRLPFVWLDFESGGEGVFLLSKEDLNAAF